MNRPYARLSDIGLAVASANAEFLVFGCQHPPDSKIQLALIQFLPVCLKYLGLAFGTLIRATRSLTINALREKVAL